MESRAVGSPQGAGSVQHIMRPVKGIVRANIHRVLEETVWHRVSLDLKLRAWGILYVQAGVRRPG